MAEKEPTDGEQSGQKQAKEPVELERQKGVDYVTTTTAPIDQFRPELDDPSQDVPAGSDSNPASAQGSAEGGADPGGE